MNAVTKSKTFTLTAHSLDEALRYADILSKSDIVPKNYKGKPGDILVAVQHGAEIGLSPLQALQSLAVINGKPSIYGDGLLALCKSHPKWEWMKEYEEEDEKNGTTAVCIIKRKGEEANTVKFSVADAKKAGLWGKVGPWTNYPRRMRQMRARGFNLRDTFPDALSGLIIAEEAQDYPKEMKNVTPSGESHESRSDAIVASLASHVKEVEAVQEVDTTPRPTDMALDNIMKRFKELGMNEEDVLEEIGVRYRKDITMEKFQEIIAMGTKLRDKKEN